jgi:hypothetical protein
MPCHLATAPSYNGNSLKATCRSRASYSQLNSSKPLTFRPKNEKPTNQAFWRWAKELRLNSKIYRVSLPKPEDARLQDIRQQALVVFCWLLNIFKDYSRPLAPTNAKFLSHISTLPSEAAGDCASRFLQWPPFEAARNAAVEISQYLSRSRSYLV